MGNGYRILVAEDDAVSRRLFVRFLEKNGFFVLVANTGCEAVAFYQKGKIHLILMDVRMPEMDGFTATKRIREHEKISGGHVPILAVTACAIQGDREKCLAAGMDDYITKPIDLEDLINRIYRWLKAY
jgi:CheY-like chemotaxis protein